MGNQQSGTQAGISLPKGGGAIKGIGETFQPDLFTGTGNFSIPIATTPGRNGFGPKIKLQYSTGNGNSPFGLGWNLSIPRVSRKTEKGLPRYDGNDIFLLSGAEDLVKKLDKNGQEVDLEPSGPYRRTLFRPRTEGLFARIELWKNTEEASDLFWKITTKDNYTNIYGKSTSARIADPKDQNRIFEWLLEETYDAKGNHILYEYQQDYTAFQPDKIFEQNRQYTQTYIKRILYGNTPSDLPKNKQVGHVRERTHHQNPLEHLTRHYLFEVLFDYGDIPEILPVYDTAQLAQPWWEPKEDGVSNIPSRNDAFSVYRSGFEIRTLRRCHRVLMLHHFNEDQLKGAPLVKSTNFSYGQDSYSEFSVLKKVTQWGYRKDAENNAEYIKRSLPPITFEYSKFLPEHQTFESVQAEGGDMPPLGLEQSNMSILDIFGNGLPDFVQSGANGFNYWENQGEARISSRYIPKQTFPADTFLGAPNVTVADLGGDGLPDLIKTSPELVGFYEATTDGGWKNFKQLENFPNLDLSNPNVQMVDLTGDGLSDILITEDTHFKWYKSLGEVGYEPQSRINRTHDLQEFPDVFFSDPRVRLADMSGDGLNDIVLIHSGRVDYWPNLGYGHFGKRVTMGAAPKFDYAFDPSRLFMVDLNGTGCADLVYVELDRVSFWFNQSGNNWSEEHTIIGTPDTTNISGISFSDFYGTGTACLIWSYPYGSITGSNYKVLDFCGKTKPHLLIEMDNNMGATTRVQYASSTKFYLEDKKSGIPWVTNLPFPVQVVEKTETIDHISKTKLVTKYKYHHGYYDGREREFRGFGRVDQQDTEYFDEFLTKRLHGQETNFTNREFADHVPPILTKNWFHTGMYFDENLPSASGTFYDKEDMMAAYRSEFYKEDPRAFQTSEHEVEVNDTPHEAYRALRGALIRSEVYTLDGTDKEKYPYAVSENRYLVNQFQVKGNNEHAVYLSLPKEKISYHYERIPDDPRITHQINLEYDDFGNLRESVAISYPRRNPLKDKHGDPYPEQADIKAIYSFVRFINQPEQDDYYYIGLSCETKSFEVHGLDFQWPTENVATQALKAEIFDLIRGKNNYENYDGPLARFPGLRKRIIEWSRQYYRTDIDPEQIDPIGDLSHRLEFGKIESMALPYGSYLAAFTNDQIENVLPDNAGISDNDFKTEGGYHRETAGELGSEPDNNLTDYWWIPSGRQSFNKNLFYLSDEIHDPFGNPAFITYDDYGLLMKSAKDAVHNVIEAENDYRVLQPFKIKDPNDNYSQVAFDALGLVVGTAAWGEDTSGLLVGDSLNDFIPDLEQEAITHHINDPLNVSGAVERNPHDILGKATTRLIYDLKRFQTTGEPNVVYTMAREVHSLSPGGDNSRIQHSFLYSDGFGREVQTKIQAEPETGASQIRWVGSGSKVYNNKGKIVREYEPFFSGTNHFGIEQHGVSPILFYDPLERVICTLHPNHTYEKVVFDPWRQETWDANDTIHPSFRYDPQNPNDFANHQFEPVNDPDIGKYFRLLKKKEYCPTWYFQRMDDAEALRKWPDNNDYGDPLPEQVRKRNRQIRQAEKVAAQKASYHAATPSITHLDCLGRVFLTIADNGRDKNGVDQFIANSVKLDIEGNDIIITDPRQIEAFKHVFDIAGRKLKVSSVDAGMEFMLPDITGEKSIYSRDAEENEVKVSYDKLRRPIETRVKRKTDIEFHLSEKTIYGESPLGIINPENFNLRGKVWSVYDGAGLVTNNAYDFKGNLLSLSRRFLSNGIVQVEWPLIAHVFDLLQAETKLEPLSKSYTVTIDYDALNRITSSQMPDGSIHKPVYNEANLLEALDIIKGGSSTKFVMNIDYNAKGQRTKIAYHNNVSTDYTYEPETYRLASIKTRRQGARQNKDLQDLKYTYDPVGNITQIRDDAHSKVFHNNTIVEPVSKYTYDSIYRLTEATGREHESMSACHYQAKDKKHTEFIQYPQPLSNARAICKYREQYTYDKSGNIEVITHQNLTRNTRWKRVQQYQVQNPILSPDQQIPVSNRLHSSNAGCTGENAFVFTHDASGNILSFPHLPVLKWDFKNQLVEVQLNVGANPDKAFYQYDSNGQRVRKTIVKAGKIEERIYLGGYEVYLEKDGSGTSFRRDTVHVMDDKNRIALIETEIDPASSAALNTRIRYQLSNHLGSSILEVDDSSNAEIISYEEYYPYGGTAYLSGKDLNETKLKRYRYSGKERDDETGFYYYGARYYIPWIGRWTTTDPTGFEGGMNLFEYVSCNPLKYTDPHGLQKANNIEPKLTDNDSFRLVDIDDESLISDITDLINDTHDMQLVRRVHMELERISKALPKAEEASSAIGVGLDIEAVRAYVINRPDHLEIRIEYNMPVSIGKKIKVRLEQKEPISSDVRREFSLYGAIDKEFKKKIFGVSSSAEFGFATRINITELGDLPFNEQPLMLFVDIIKELEGRASISAEIPFNVELPFKKLSSGLRVQPFKDKYTVRFEGKKGVYLRYEFSNNLGLERIITNWGVAANRYVSQMFSPLLFGPWF